MARAFREGFDARVGSVVKRIPRGRVATYGQVAKLAGSPMAARMVSGALRRGEGLPWWRVLGRDGSLRIMQPDLRLEQWERLEAEGVRVSPEGVVDLARHGWKPRKA